MEHFWLIWLVSVLCALCAIPIQSNTIRQHVQLQSAIYPTKKVPPISVMVTIMIIQSCVFLALATAIGLWLMPSTGLRLWVLDHWVSRTELPFSIWSFWAVSIGSGITVGLLVKWMDGSFFQQHMTKRMGNEPISSRFFGFLSSFYGGVCEEVLMRLGVMTVVVFLAQKMGGMGISYWLGICVAAIVFAISHLPTNYMTYGKGYVVTVWTLLLNGILGILFGFLYWRYGLEAAIISHFSADIVLHVIFKNKSRK
ncbi:MULTISPECIES: type II CAAX prenyl endopeptidase Rce1 family protein [Brevibacillus]|uniref:CPBP family glutamic-type intramembrane protease n=1 Tax=Brevibacillus TaxID=55080 RepID=UPI000D10EA1C|nr:MULTISPECIES: CPBP family glutamic-type intramembrane protease [Brevibacillus]MED1943942.1 CPBP family glutamic-type intramembrane protease [Brevibacillus formosus]MED1999686.1 CPBP family glutamic-type intramembrane protease [Brevibacillus formosus]MED2082177.1 CPBP family glutamic-type intramembrane protease [Brevibacillus formosus]PSK18896.1 CPBP family intramembrane metalloprotease [Brevibacillus sp. NRRL NRS-603]